MQNEPLETKINTPKAVPDILPGDHEYQTYIKKVVRHRCRQAGFRRITTPMFEKAELFDQALGKDSDSAEKLYRFEDQNGEQLAMKPDSTMSIARAYLQHNMAEWPQPVEFYYIDPHFRYEKEAGRGVYRQFWQFGFEIIGESDPALDAQMIQMCHIIFEDLGIAEPLTLQINNIGDAECQEAYNQALRDYFFDKERYLSDKCKRDLEINPMRLLNSKNEDVAILAELAPTIDLFLDEASKKDFKELQEFLDELGIEYEVNGKLIREADYYTGTVFEFWEKAGKAPKEIGSGGHFDDLIENIGGESTPGIGFAAGIERIISLMKREKLKVPSKDNLHVFVAQLSGEAKKKCLNLIRELREQGIKTMGAMGKGAIRHQLSIAEKFKVPYTLLLGLTEVREGTIIIRDMKVGTQEIVPFDEAIPRLIDKLGEKTLDKYSPGEILY